MQRIQGDLLQYAEDGHFDVIVHGCNCFCTMGAGIAKSIKAQFPAAYAADLQTTAGDCTNLGTYTVATIALEHGDLRVVNAYTQYHYRGKGRKVEYDAVRSCMAWIKANYPGLRIGLPKIGAGLAGGDWETIAHIIDEELAGEHVTLVEFVP